MEDPVASALDEINMNDLEVLKEEFVPAKNKVSNPIPETYDPAWTDYVLTQFQDYELFNGNPTTSGLRRVANKLLGEIVESISRVAQSPSPSNDNHAVVEHVVRIRMNNDPADERMFGDVADVYVGNTDAAYAVYSTATAATRAEGRALRKALMLQRVLAAEELSNVAPENPTKISKGQITFINMMCERNNISVKKLIKFGKNKRYDNIEDLPYGTAVQIASFLNECQNGKRKIPDDLIGYDPEWRNQ